MRRLEVVSNSSFVRLCLCFNRHFNHIKWFTVNIQIKVGVFCHGNFINCFKLKTGPKRGNLPSIVAAAENSPSNERRNGAGRARWCWPSQGPVLCLMKHLGGGFSTGDDPAEGEGDLLNTPKRLIESEKGNCFPLIFFKWKNRIH